MGTNSEKKPSQKLRPVSYAQAVSQDGPHPQPTAIPHDKSQQQDEESSDEETLSTLTQEKRDTMLLAMFKNLTEDKNVNRSIAKKYTNAKAMQKVLEESLQRFPKWNNIYMRSAML